MLNKNIQTNKIYRVNENSWQYNARVPILSIHLRKQWCFSGASIPAPVNWSTDFKLLIHTSAYQLQEKYPTKSLLLQMCWKNSAFRAYLQLAGQLVGQDGGWDKGPQNDLGWKGS